jgi:kumamolisin
MEQRFAIPGSKAHHDLGGRWIPADQAQHISPTIVIRRSTHTRDLRQSLLSGSMPAMSRDEAEALLRVDPEDLTAVIKFTEAYALSVVSENSQARTVQVEGTLLDVGQAFGIDIECRVDPEGREYLSYQGALTIPADLEGVIEAVLGIDQRPIARRGAAQ